MKRTRKLFATLHSFRNHTVFSIFLLETTLAIPVTFLNWSLLLQLRLFSEVTESLSHLAPELLPQQDSKSNATHSKFLCCILCNNHAKPSSTESKCPGSYWDTDYLQLPLLPSVTDFTWPLRTQTFFPKFCPFSLSVIRYDFFHVCTLGRTPFGFTVWPTSLLILVWAAGVTHMGLVKVQLLCRQWANISEKTVRVNHKNNFL